MSYGKNMLFLKHKYWLFVLFINWEQFETNVY